MKTKNPKMTSIPAKTGSLIVRAFLISMGLLMSHEVFAQTYQLGDRGPGGGKVYFLESGGEHGLEAQAADYDNGGDLYWDWYEARTAAASYNTECEVPVFLTLLDPWCWHLPTKTELELLYEQRDVVGGFAYEDYWSSTSYSDFFAWGMHFLHGSQYSLRKDHHRLRVRAVRLF